MTATATAPAPTTTRPRRRRSRVVEPAAIAPDAYAPGHRLGRVELRKGSRRMVLGVEVDEAGTAFWVGEARYYWTARSARIGGREGHAFEREDWARAYANTWYRRLLVQGWERTA